MNYTDVFNAPPPHETAGCTRRAWRCKLKTAPASRRAGVRRRGLPTEAWRVATRLWLAILTATPLWCTIPPDLPPLPPLPLPRSFALLPQELLGATRQLVPISPGDQLRAVMMVTMAVSMMLPQHRPRRPVIAPGTTRWCPLPPLQRPPAARTTRCT